MKDVVIAGTGSCLPRRVMTNEELEQMVDTSDQWIRERTGICQRHIASADETTASLGSAAATQAMEAAGCSAGDIDLLLLATTTPDQVFPSTACQIQKHLGIHNTAAFDMQAVCSGFLYGLDTARRYLGTGGGETALVIGSEVMSRIINWKDRNTCVLFGDGAGAVVLRSSDRPGILSTHLHADGSYDDLLQVPPASDEQPQPYITMKGNEVFKMAVTTLGRIAGETLQSNGLRCEDIDWLVPHQANYRIIDATARKLGLPMERVVVTVDRHGNTSSASVPLALDTAVRDGRIRPGDVLMLEAFGGGFTWGSALIRY